MLVSFACYLYLQSYYMCILFNDNQTNHMLYTCVNSRVYVLYIIHARVCVLGSLYTYYVLYVTKDELYIH